MFSALSKARTTALKGRNLLVKGFKPPQPGSLALTSHTGYVSTAVGKKTQRASLNFTQVSWLCSCLFV